MIIRRVLENKFAFAAIVLAFALAVGLSAAYGSDLPLSSRVLLSSPVELADGGPSMPPDPWDGLVADGGPSMPPDPWDGLVADGGPSMPPDPWDGLTSFTHHVNG